MTRLNRWDLMRAAATAAAGALAFTAWRLVESAPATAAAAQAAEVPVYSGGLAAGWQDWSWAPRSLASTEETYDGKPVIRMEPANYNGLFLHHGGFDTHGYSALWFMVNGGSTGGQHLVVCTVGQNKAFGRKVSVEKAIPDGQIPASGWALILIPLTSLKATDTVITGISIQEAVGQKQPPVYIADVKFVGGSRRSGPESITLTVDATRLGPPISPLIYGMASAPPEYLRDLRLGSNRWGGNPNTRYNWELGNCWNAARDWEFRNGNYGNTDEASRRPSGVADRFVMGNRAAGVASILTIPTIGWVAKDDNNETRSVDVPKNGGPPVAPGSSAIAGYDPTWNRHVTSVRSLPHKPGPFQDPPDRTDDVVYQDEWVYHLTRRFGTAAQGGVRFYAMDNEPDLWAGVHTDVHPVTVSYDNLLSNFLQYATAVKAVDPSAKVTGPVSWGWTGYFYSPRDGSNWGGRPDRKAHGDMELIPWFLDQVHKHDQKTGKRTLDALDIHFYPQGANVYGGGTDAATNSLRLRSTRGLWDPTYVDESWIAQPARLIPRMKEWINKYYPGTRLAITEWNWGADKTINGGLAIAECLGVFGREGLDMANYWTTPPAGSPGYQAFRIYRNADGSGAGFGDRSVYAASSAPGDVSCFGSVDTHTGRPVAMLINKEPDRDVTVTLNVRDEKPVSRAEIWRCSDAAPAMIDKLADASAAGGTMRLTLPRYSLTLIRFR